MLSRSHFGRIWSWAGVLSTLLLCGVIGCGASEPFRLIPVKGKVTYQDGSLIRAARIEVMFLPEAKPIDAKTHPRPGRAEVNPADGTFSEATSHKYGDGLVAGKHKVKVIVYDKHEVPTELQVTPSEIEVSPENTEFDFRVKKG
jgi:hypothetical protein